VLSLNMSFTVEELVSSHNVPTSRDFIEKLTIKSYAGGTVPSNTQGFEENVLGTGLIEYRISCQNISKQCQTCYYLAGKEYCSSCNTTLYTFIAENESCTNQCGDFAKYYALSASSNVCLPCVSPCLHCTSATLCTQCVKGYFLLESNNSCVSACPIASGYF